MKKIKVEYDLRFEKEFIVPKEWEEFFDTWQCVNEEDYTDEQWELLESHSLEEFIEEQINYEDIFNAEVINYKEV